MSDASDDERDSKGIVLAAKDAILTPYRVAVSKPARKAYISSILVFLTAITLLGIAITAYTLFYFNYIPARGFTSPIYLQFDAGRHPYAEIPLSRGLVSNQPYDVKVVLHMPRTPSNRGAGNFMLDLQLLGATSRVQTEDAREVLTHERRPAIIMYYSPLMEYIHKVTAIHWHVLGWRKEAETLDISIMEGVEFAKGWRNVPAVARLELQSSSVLQVYSAKMIFTARFKGLRWFMYNHRIISFLVFSSSFWVVEMIFAGLAWAALSLLIFPSSPQSLTKLKQKQESTASDAKPTKAEDIGSGGELSEGLSDTSRNFPTFSRQPPLRYSSPRVKKEEEEEDSSLTELPQAAAEADDEDEDADYVLDASGRFADSGLGTTGMESSTDRRGIARRRSSRQLAPDTGD